MRTQPSWSSSLSISFDCTGGFVHIEQQADCELQNRIDGVLKGSTYQLGREIFTRHDEGVVVLRGRVDTYYHKQLAQELLRKLDGVERVINLLEVHWGEPHPSEIDCSEMQDENEMLAVR